MCLCFTVKLVQVKQFLVQNATTDTFQARWASVRGATGYRLTWASQSTVDKLQFFKTETLSVWFLGKQCFVLLF